jgi:hypothetical protein
MRTNALVMLGKMNLMVSIPSKAYEFVENNQYKHEYTDGFNE